MTCLSSLYKHVLQLSERRDTEELAMPRKRRALKRFEVGEGDGYHSLTFEDYYRKLHFEALDLVISSIQEYFGPLPHC